MAGLVPAIPKPNFSIANLSGMPGTQASEATPFFERLWPGMTDAQPLAARRRARLKKIAASKVSVPMTV
jgi:hypothetical protein